MKNITDQKLMNEEDNSPIVVMNKVRHMNDERYTPDEPPEDWTHLTDYNYFEDEEFVEDTGLYEEIVNQIVYLGLLGGWVIKSDSSLNNHMLGDSIERFTEVLKGEPTWNNPFNPNQHKTESDRLNYIYDEWVKENKKLEDEKDWIGLSFNQDKNRVLFWLLQKWDDIGDDKIRMEIFRNGYTSMEFPRTNIGYDFILSILEKTDNTHLMMNEEEQKVYDELPDIVKVYRGIGLKEDEELDVWGWDEGLGISWTISKEKGEWFSNRFMNKKRYLIEGWVKKENIFGYLNGRKEEEVIVEPKFVGDREITENGIKRFVGE
jgi:hypothetical protein